jgi:ESF2/ABP1 family protein
VELAQSRSEQRQYLKNVELARVLDKRAERKRMVADKAGQDSSMVSSHKETPIPASSKRPREDADEVAAVKMKKKQRAHNMPINSTIGREQLDTVLGSIF